MRSRLLLVFLLLAVFVFTFAAPAPLFAADKGSFLERLIATVIDVPVAVAKYVGGKVADLKKINELVFSHELWSDKEKRFIRAFYWGLASVCLPFFLVVIISTGFKLIYGGINPGARAEAIESIWRWFGALALVLFAPLITDLALKLCWLMVDGIKLAFEAVKTSLGLQGSIGDLASGTFSGDVKIETGSVLGTAIVKVFFVGIWWWFNFVYLIRKFVLTIMLIAAPLMFLFWAANRNVPAFAIWFGELGSNALMPVAHALVLCLILGLVDVKNVSDGTWFQVAIALMVFVPATEMIRNSIQHLFIRWAGVDESGLAGKAAAILGFGGLLSVGRLAGTVTGSGSPPPPPPGGSGGSGGSVPVPQGPLPAGGPIPAPAGGTPPMTMSGGLFGITGPPPGVPDTGPPILKAPPGGGGGGPGLGPSDPGGKGGFGTAASSTGGGGSPGRVSGGPSPGLATANPWSNVGQFAKRQAAGTLSKGVGFTARAAGAVIGGAFRATLSSIPGTEGAGRAAGDWVSGKVSGGVRYAAGTLTLGGKYAHAWRGGTVEQVFGKKQEAVQNVFRNLQAVSSGKTSLDQLIQAPTLRPNAPRYSGSGGGLGSKIP